MKHKPRGSIHPRLSQQETHTHRECSFLPERKCSLHKYLEFTNWKNLLCLNSGKFFKHSARMDSLYLSPSSLVSSEMSWGYGKHTQVGFDQPRASCVCRSVEKPLFCFAIRGALSCVLIGRLVTRNAMWMCFKAGECKLSAGRGADCNKHVCMSLCLHLELKFHEHRCFSTAPTHSRSALS